MAWSRPFDDPITLPDGRVLPTLAASAAIAVAAALIYFTPGGLEVTQLDPSQLVGP